jgi:hypothetical protein
MRPFLLSATAAFALFGQAHGAELILPGILNLPTPAGFEPDYCLPREGPMEQITPIAEQCFRYSNREALRTLVQGLALGGEWRWLRDEGSGVPPIMLERPADKPGCREILHFDLGSYWVGKDTSALRINYVRFFLFIDPSCSEGG